MEDISFNTLFDGIIIKKIPLLDLSVILDNLVNNSTKAKATKVHIDFAKDHDMLIVDFSDNGVGVDSDIVSGNSIFELGITNRSGGSGIGLSTIKETMHQTLKGDIIFRGNGLHFDSGATFRLIFRWATNFVL